MELWNSFLAILAKEINKINLYNIYVCLYVYDYEWKQDLVSVVIYYEKFIFVLSQQDTSIYIVSMFVCILYKKYRFSCDISLSFPSFFLAEPRMLHLSLEKGPITKCFL